MMEENRLLAKHKKDLEQKDKEFELKYDQVTTEADQQNPFFNEHFDKTKSELGPHRYIPYNFKGLRHDQIEGIELERQQQLKEAEYQKEQAKEEERLWGLQAEHLRKLTIKQDRQLKKDNRDVTIAKSQTNVAQKSEHYMKWKDPYGDRS